jgi:hypothetical protein
MAMLFLIYAECRIFHCYAKCRCSECRYAECRFAECRCGECHYAECLGAQNVCWKIIYKFLTVPYLDSGPAFLSQMFWVKAKEFYSAHVLKKVCEYPPWESINQASNNGDVWSSK